MVTKKKKTTVKKKTAPKAKKTLKNTFFLPHPLTIFTKNSNQLSKQLTEKFNQSLRSLSDSRFLEIVSQKTLSLASVLSRDFLIPWTSDFVEKLNLT